jgi:hypothetical protein
MKGIPIFKTLNNGPWLVSEREVREALGAYASAGADLRAKAEAESRWTSWLDWLRVTEQHGGFRVK